MDKYKKTWMQFAAFLKDDVEKWGKVVRFSGAKVE